jgi:hypothetical protein
MRLLRTINKIDWNNMTGTAMITLTYPDECRTERYAARTRQREAFMKRLYRHIGSEVPSIWRAEWKPRLTGEFVGHLVSHLHILLPGIPWIGRFKVNEMWTDILGYTKILQTAVTPISAGDGGARYLSKYVSKDLDISAYLAADDPIDFGRHWGIGHPELMPWCPLVVNRKLSPDEENWCQEYARQAFPQFKEAGQHGYTRLGLDLVKFFLAKFGQNVLTDAA